MTHHALNTLQYPIFEANQVLTNRHLNDLLRYLDDSDRATRAHAIGTGWLGGAEAKINMAGGTLTSIRLGCGAGITSAGYLAVLEEGLLQYAVAYDDPFRFVPDNEDDAAQKGYDPFWTGQGDNRVQHEIWELKTSAGVANLTEAERTAAEAAFKALSPQDYVVLAYVETQQQDIKSCLDQDCNDRGQRMLLNVRTLAMRRSDIAPAAAFESAREPEALAPLMLRRITDYSSGDLPAIYAPVFADMINRLAVSMDVFFGKFKDHLEYKINRWSRTTFRNRLTAARGRVSDTQIQIFYDFLRDLVCSYNAMLEEAVPLMSQACVDETAFPKHLLIGEMIPQNRLTPFPEVRHYFRPPTAAGGEEEAVWRIRRGYQKIQYLIQRFMVGNLPSGIKVAPQAQMAPSTNLIPYYYNLGSLVGAQLRQLWDPSASAGGTSGQETHHFRDGGPHPFDRNVDNDRIVRVEGILGSPVATVKSRLEALIRRFGLSIDVMDVYADGGFATRSDYPQLVAHANDYDTRRTDFLFQLKAIQRFLVRTVEDYGTWVTYLSDRVPPANTLISAAEALARSLEDHVADTNRQEFLRRYYVLLDEAARYRALFADFLREVLDAPLRSPNVAQPGMRGGSPYHVVVALAFCELLKHLDRLFSGLDPNALTAVISRYGAELATIQAADPRQFDVFYALHRGLDHIAGAPFGGTLVLLIDGGLVVGDFYLPYRCCCPCPPMVQHEPAPAVFPHYHESIWRKQLLLGPASAFGADRGDLFITDEDLPADEMFGDEELFLRKASRFSNRQLPATVGEHRSLLYLDDHDGEQYLVLEPRVEASGSLINFTIGAKGDRLERYPIWVALTRPYVVAHDDVAVTIVKEPVTIPVLRNDLMPTPEIGIEITRPPERGKVDTIDKKGLFFIYTPGSRGQGIDFFEYVLVCYLEDGEQLVSHARVTVHIVECCEEDRVDEPPVETGGEIELPSLLFCDTDPTKYYHFKTTGTAREIEGPGMGYFNRRTGKLETSLTGKQLSDQDMRDRQLQRVFVPGAPDVEAGTQKFEYTVNKTADTTERRTYKAAQVIRFADTITTKRIGNGRTYQFSHSHTPSSIKVNYGWIFDTKQVPITTRTGGRAGGTGFDLIGLRGTIADGIDDRLAGAMAAALGNFDSTEAKPKHTYPKAGIYSVTLVVSPQAKSACVHIKRTSVAVIDDTVIFDGGIIRDIPREWPPRITLPVEDPPPRIPPGIDWGDFVDRTYSEFDSWHSSRSLIATTLETEDGLRKYREGAFDKTMEKESAKIFRSVKTIADATDASAGNPAEVARAKELGTLIENPAATVAEFFAGKPTVTPEAKSSFREALDTMKAGRKAGVRYSDGFIASLDKVMETAASDEARRYVAEMKKIAST